MGNDLVFFTVASFFFTALFFRTSRWVNFPMEGIFSYNFSKKYLRYVNHSFMIILALASFSLFLRVAFFPPLGSTYFLARQFPFAHFFSRWHRFPVSLPSSVLFFFDFNGWEAKEMAPTLIPPARRNPAQEVTSDRDCTMDGSRSLDRSEVSSSSAQVGIRMGEPGAESSPRN